MPAKAACDEPIGFIGAGRLGQALALALHDSGFHVRAVGSARPASARAMAAALPRCEALSPQQVAQACELVFITTPDAAIGTTVSAVNWRPGQAVVHCSGATELAVMAHAADQGAALGGFHPLQTFGADAAAAARSLPQCTITVEAHSAALDERLVAIARALGCAVNRLPPGMRSRYHAAAGYASQFINALLADAAHVWASWGASEGEAVAALLPLMRGTLDAIAAAGIARGMPGPVSRGDVHTVAQHMAAMRVLGEPVLSSCRLLCERTVPLALARGAIDAPTARQLRGILSSQKSHPKAHVA